MGDFDRVYRENVDVRTAIESQFRRVASEGTTRSAPSSRPDQPIEAAPGERASIPRRIARAAYHAVKPVLRPFTARARRYLNAPLVVQMNEIYARTEGIGLQVAEQSDAAQRVGEQLAAFGLQLEAVAEGFARARSELAEARRAIDSLAAANVALSRDAATAAVFAASAARRIAVAVGPGEILVRTEVGYVMVSSDDHAVLASLIEAGDPEPGTRRLIESILEPGGVFVDVGAHIGMHTLAAARILGPLGRVVAIEPYEPSAHLLRRSIAINGYSGTVTVHTVAAASRDGLAGLHLGWISSHHSLFPLDPAEAPDDVSVEVPAARLDSMLADVQRVDLIKIDAEGSELEVLAGAETVIGRNPDIGLIVEFGPSHLERTGHTVEEWIEAFESLGLGFMAINETTGMLEDLSIAELVSLFSVNLLFARPGSGVWSRATPA